jgi:hypothetical protein
LVFPLKIKAPFGCFFACKTAGAPLFWIRARRLEIIALENYCVTLIFVNSFASFLLRKEAEFEAELQGFDSGLRQIRSVAEPTESYIPRTIRA